MGKVVHGIAVITKLTAKALRWMAVMLLRLSKLVARLTGRGGLAFASSSGETKTTSLASLAGAAAGLVLSMWVEISFAEFPLSSALVLGLLGLLLGGLAGYSAVKKVRVLTSAKADDTVIVVDDKMGGLK